VKYITLDSYISYHGISKVALLKIDTQGHELHVLRGAVKSLTAGKIDAVFAENDINLMTVVGVKPEQIFSLMTDAGFRGYKERECVALNGRIVAKEGTVPLATLDGHSGYNVMWLRIASLGT
jgi:hypothetical protein